MTDPEDLRTRRRALPGAWTNTRRYMPCMDCDEDTWSEYYMISHDLWHEIVGSRAGYLCVPCLEHRLGRRLEPADFLPCPCNDDTWRKTPRLKERMQRCL